MNNPDPPGAEIVFLDAKAATGEDHPLLHQISGCHMCALTSFQWILVLYTLLWPTTGRAQDRAGFIGGGDEGAADSSGNPGPQVYLNDSFEAADALARAKSLAASGRWEQAVRLLQQTADQSGDALVRLSQDHFVSVRDHVQELMAQWPKAGIAAYRMLFEDALREAVAAQPRPLSSESLLPLFHRYFCTASAASLADTIGQLAIEAGDLALARRVYQRVLDYHPDRSLYEAHYVAMLALVRAMNGEKVNPNAAQWAGVTLRWKGEERPLSDVLAQVGESFRPLETPLNRSEWPLVGGEPARNGRGTTHVDELGLLWRFDDLAQNSADAERDRDDGEKSTRHARPQAMTIYPVADEDNVYVQDYREVIALHRTTGVPAWRFGRDETPQDGLGAVEEQPSAWQAPTVKGERVFAVLPGDVTPMFGYESVQNPPELVCLDARSGELIWPEDRELYARTLPEVSFDTSPIVDNGHVYVVGRRRRSFGFEDCYIFRFAAADGTLEFQTHLGSASSGSFGSPRPTASVAALKGDTLYVCTNLGSIGAVSAHTGAVRWIRLYARDRSAARREAAWSVRSINPWAFNPVLVTDDAVIAMPTDAGRVLAMDPEDGQELWSVPAGEIGQCESILGIHDDLLCGVGKEAACYDLTAHSLRWSTSFPDGDSALGRAVWTDDRVLAATATNLCSFAVADGTRSDLNWHSAEGGGNLLPLSDELVVAGDGWVAAYVRKAEIWNRLRNEMAAHPDDPTPALEFAEVALRGGEYDKALQILNDAVGRMKATTSKDSERLRRRFFDDVLTFAEVLRGASRLDSSVLDKLYSYAQEFPAGPANHLRLALRFAELFAARGAPDRAAGLYQQILADRSLRDLPVAGVGSETAAARAHGKIAELIEHFGRSIYEPFEAQARRALELGRTGHDEATLARVVEVYPNSTAAVEALELQGEVLNEARRHDDAAVLWARAYHQYPGQIDRPALIRKIADAYQEAGRPAHAYRWLTKGTREYPDALLDFQGGLVTFFEYRKRLADVREAMTPSRPGLHPPLTGSFERADSSPQRLLVPQLPDNPIGNWSRYFVQDTDGVHAFDARTNRLLWMQPVDTGADAELLSATDDLAVLATEERIFGVEVATGRVLWSVGDNAGGVDDPMADWEGGKAFRAHAIIGSRLLSVRVDGQIICVDLTTGSSIWSASQHPPPGAAVEPGDPWVVYHGMKDDQVVLYLIDASDGVLVRTIETEESRPVERASVTLDGQVIVTTSQSVLSFDGDSGKRRWRTELDSHLKRSSFLFDLDAVYFVEEDARVRKLSLENGATLWRSEPLPMGSAANVTVERHGNQVIVSTSSSISGLDDASGEVLWHGTTPEGAKLLYRFVTDSYFVAIDAPEESKEADAVAYFYKLKEGSGVIPREGGRCNLGRLTELKAIMAADGAIIYQTGQTIHGRTE